MTFQEIPDGIYELGQQYYAGGMEQLDRIAYDERLAKTAVLAGFVMSTAVLLSGIPGTGKSLLSRHAHRMFEDITNEDIAVVPPASDLQPVQLVGGLMETTKEVNDGTSDKPRTITSKTHVKGIVQPHHKKIWLDELTRINPHAVNDLLGAPEEHELKTTAGVVPLENLHILISTMNPSETRQATFKVSDAMISRHSLGVIMGHEITHESKLSMAQNKMPDVDKVESIWNTGVLRQLRSAIDNTLLPDAQAERVVLAAEATQKEIRERFNIAEGDRMIVQIGRLARTLGLFHGRKANDEDVNTAVGLTLGARIGAAVPQNTYEELNKATEAVLSQTA